MSNDHFVDKSDFSMRDDAPEFNPKHKSGKKNKQRSNKKEARHGFNQLPLKKEVSPQKEMEGVYVIDASQSNKA